MARVLKAAQSRGVPVGIFCADAADAAARLAQGYALVTPGNDFAHLTRSVSGAVRALLDDTPEPTQAATGYGY